MKSQTFRLSEKDIDLLKLVAAKRGTSQADAIRFCIGCGADAIREEGGETGYGASAEAVSAAVSALADQLAVKDAQIARLQDALDRAQETTKAAQVLHARERPAIESVEQKEAGRWRWPWSRG